MVSVQVVILLAGRHEVLHEEIGMTVRAVPQQVLLLQAVAHKLLTLKPHLVVIEKVQAGGMQAMTVRAIQESLCMEICILPKETLDLILIKYRGVITMIGWNENVI